MKHIGLAILISMILTAGHASAERSYLVVKGGMFTPNGTSTSGTSPGLGSFDAGTSLHAGFGHHLAPYAVIEGGVGFYTAEYPGAFGDPSSTLTCTGIPVTLLLKGVIRNERLELSAGAGAGYFSASLEHSYPGGSTTAHGAELGYLLTGGIAYLLTDSFSAGFDATWFDSRPMIDLATAGGKREWNVGGLNLNLSLTYRFP